MLTTAALCRDNLGPHPRWYPAGGAEVKGQEDRLRATPLACYISGISKAGRPGLWDPPAPPRAPNAGRQAHRGRYRHRAQRSIQRAESTSCHPEKAWAWLMTARLLLFFIVLSNDVKCPFFYDRVNCRLGWNLHLTNLIYTFCNDVNTVIFKTKVSVIVSYKRIFENTYIYTSAF